MGLAETKFSQLKRRGAENTHKLFFDVYRNTVNILKPLSKLAKEDVDVGDHRTGKVTNDDVNKKDSVLQERCSHESKTGVAEEKVLNDILQSTLDTNHNMLSEFQDGGGGWRDPRFERFCDWHASGSSEDDLQNKSNTYFGSEDEVSGSSGHASRSKDLRCQLNRDNVVSFYNSFPHTFADHDQEIVSYAEDGPGCHSESESNEKSLPYWCSCSNPYCNYTCHMRCSAHVTLNCNSPSIAPQCRDHRDLASTEATLPVDALQFSESGERILTCAPIRSQELHCKISAYNASASPGKEMVLSDDGQSVSGFIRVHMNLCRPINVVSESKPLSLQNIIYPAKDGISEKTLTSFYLPRDTIKSLHVNSSATTQEVINALLKKFKVADNPRKYALYERYYDSRESMRVKMRRLQDTERPLLLALICSETQESTAQQSLLHQQQQFVLQENDTGDIPWEAFSLPELNNFLKILKREEEEYLNQVRLKYKYIQMKLQEIMDQWEAANGSAQVVQHSDDNVEADQPFTDSAYSTATDRATASSDAEGIDQSYAAPSVTADEAKEDASFPSPSFQAAPGVVYPGFHPSSQLLDVS